MGNAHGAANGRFTHGACVGPHNGRPSEYKTWRGMKQRCQDPRHAHYDRYGGRGITVCSRWSQSFTDFLADVGPRPKPGMTLERVDNNGNYEPGNVRWATRKEQAANRVPYRLTPARHSALVAANRKRWQHHHRAPA